jgi:hypothetical protein
MAPNLSVLGSFARNQPQKSASEAAKSNTCAIGSNQWSNSRNQLATHAICAYRPSQFT